MTTANHLTTFLRRQNCIHAQAVGGAFAPALPSTAFSAGWAAHVPTRRGAFAVWAGSTARSRHPAHHSRSLLASGNLDLGSGSALDLLTGNANLFADDMAVNRYNRAMAGWEAGEAAKQQEYMARQYDSQASYLKKTSGSVGRSLLTGIVKGSVSGLGAYSMAGGQFDFLTPAAPNKNKLLGAQLW